MRALKFHSLFLIKLLNFSISHGDFFQLFICQWATAAAGGGHSDVGPVSRFPATLASASSRKFHAFRAIPFALPPAATCWRSPLQSKKIRIHSTVKTWALSSVNCLPCKKKQQRWERQVRTRGYIMDRDVVRWWLSTIDMGPLREFRNFFIGLLDTYPSCCLSSC